MYVCMYVYIYVCMYVFMYIHVCMYVCVAVACGARLTCSVFMVYRLLLSMALVARAPI